MQTPSCCLVASTCSEHLSRPWETLKVHGLWARVPSLILGCTLPHLFLWTHSPSSLLCSALAEYNDWALGTPFRDSLALEVSGLTCPLGDIGWRLMGERRMRSENLFFMVAFISLLKASPPVRWLSLTTREPHCGFL